MIFAVANQKGGVGKTTTAVNLAAALAMLGNRVLLVDVDPQGNATMACGLDPKKLESSVYNVLLGEIAWLDAKIQPFPLSKLQSLDLIAANRDLSGAEVELVKFPDREYLLRVALAEAEPVYDYIILDCPPTLSLLTLNTLCVAQRVLIPMQCEYYALGGLTDLVSTLRRVRQQLNPILEIEGLVRTMYDARNTLATQVSNQLIEYFQRKVFQTIIPRNIKLAEAPSFGMPCILYEPSCRGSKAYVALAEELLMRSPTSVAPVELAEEL